MKPTFKTPLILLLILVLSACQSAAPESAAPPKTSPAQPTTNIPTTENTQPTAAETFPTESIPVTEEPALPDPAQPVTSTVTMETPPMPILTQDYQDLTFGSGQMIVAFGEGFLPGEAVAISLIHAEQGVLLNKSTSADSLGYAMAIKRLTKEATDKDALPPGQYTYRLAGSAQTLEFRFTVDYFYQPEPSAAKGCGYYPEKAVFEGYQVFWCAGLEPGGRYALTSQLGDGTVLSTVMDRVINTSDAFGLVVFPLRQSSDTLAPGLWTVTLGQVLADGQEPVDIGIPPLSVQILAPGGANP